MIFLFTFFILGILFYKLLIPFFTIRVLDKPDTRKDHKSPVPSGGGILFSIIGSIFSLQFNNFIPLICLPLSLIGFLDDIKNLSSLKRYIAQIITAILLICFLDIELLNQLPENLKLFAIFLIVIFITSLINFINFMDGLDGLVISNMILIILTASFSLNLNFSPVLALMLSFLFWNWSPAKIFMGDAGSTFLGAIYAGIILKSPSIEEAISLILISLPLIGDATCCLLRRLINKQQIFKPHTLHLYQRLSKSKMSSKKICFIYIFSTLLLCLTYYFLNFNYLITVSIFIIIFGIFLEKRFALAFK